MQHKHLFFDMDKTVAPARQPIRDEMFQLLNSLPHDLILVSGQLVEKIKWQSNALPAAYLGQNGNHAVDQDGTELWHTPLSEKEVSEVMEHISLIESSLEEKPNPAYNPIENRGGQITYSPIGNTAPVELKMKYDPDRSKRLSFMKRFPLQSETMMVVIGGSTSFDYIPKQRHKGTNVRKFIEHKHWDPDECIYFGDGLYPGGNDEFVIGVIETVLVSDERDTHARLKQMFQ